MKSILWAVFVIVLIVRVVGQVTGLAGAWINLLLIIAVAILAYNLISDRRSIRR